MAEVVGTYCLVFVGTGAVVVDAATGGPIGHGGAAAAFGLVVAAMVFALGPLSGAHLNPAVTLALAIGRRLPIREAPWYWSAQLLAGIAASLTLRGLFGTVGGLGATRPTQVSDGGALALEAGLTALLVLVILAVATDTPACAMRAAVAIGATVTVLALVFGPVTGASMNPARSLGPALATGDVGGLWIYLGGPPLGAVIGLALHRALTGPAPDSPHPSPKEASA